MSFFYALCKATFHFCTCMRGKTIEVHVYITPKRIMSTASFPLKIEWLEPFFYLQKLNSNQCKSFQGSSSILFAMFKLHYRNKVTYKLCVSTKCAYHLSIQKSLYIGTSTWGIPKACGQTNVIFSL